MVAFSRRGEVRRHFLSLIRRSAAVVGESAVGFVSGGSVFAVDGHIFT